MSLTPAEAVDDILALFKEAWDTTGYKSHYEDKRDTRDTSMDPWASVVIRHATGQQRTLGGKGQRLFLRLGVIVVTINTPSNSGLSGGLVLAKLVSDAYEGVSSPNGVWFRNVRINELGREGTFFQTNVISDLEYHEKK